MIGKQILHYKILEELGEGGMGVVYKAEDTKLKREVALKFLPTNALQSKEEKERFTREAQAAAALNHAYIAHIYAIEEYDGQMFIAMEFVEGRELSEIIGASRPDGTPMPLDKVIDTITQIAGGLQAAHEKGIIHRDIKSANIMVTDKGVVKIMDFGLAKLANRSKMTIQGSTLGTAAYMSPEQARGEELDKRSDIWSLGVVLYEMVSGRLPFKGDYEQAVIYSILNEEPEPLTALRSGLPIALDGIVAKTLAKDPDVRYQHVDELPADLKALDTVTLSRSRISAVSKPFEGSKPLKGSVFPWIIAGLSLVAFLVALIFVFNSKDQSAVGALRLNLSLLTSQTQSLLRTDVQALALSPDGNTLAFTLSEEGQNLLYLRSLDSFTTTPIKGTTNARAPFFSPDGQWIGFLSDGKIKKVSVTGGLVQTVCDADGFRGASWGADNTIIFSPEFSSGLMAVSAEGGPFRQVSILDSTQYERTHRWPQVLPGGKWVLYTIGSRDNPNSYIDAKLAIQSIETGERHVLNLRGEMARYVDPGFLIIARNGSLLAAPFSLETFKTTQSPLPVIEDVDGDGGSGISYFGISNDGRLVYIPGIRNKDLELIWVDKQGKVEPLPLQSGSYSTPRFSPDGSRLAVTVGQQSDGNYNIWMYNLQSGSFNRFTFGNRMQDPAWSPNGKSLYFVDSGGEKRGIWTKPTDGSSSQTRIAPFELLQVAYVTPDGKSLILNRVGIGNEGNIFVLDLNRPQNPLTLFPTNAYSYSGNLSPDGRFITYGSNETGSLEIFVSTFPGQEGKWQISSASGLNPLWSPDGRELYYISPLGKMMVVPISTDPFFSSGAPRELFDVSQMFFPNSPLANYDISPDGKRFVMVRNTLESTNTQACNVILNWTAELQEKFKADE